MYMHNYYQLKLAEMTALKCESHNSMPQMLHWTQLGASHTWNSAVDVQWQRNWQMLSSRTGYFAKWKLIMHGAQIMARLKQPFMQRIAHWQNHTVPDLNVGHYYPFNECPCFPLGIPFCCWRANIHLWPRCEELWTYSILQCSSRWTSFVPLIMLLIICQV